MFQQPSLNIGQRSWNFVAKVSFVFPVRNGLQHKATPKYWHCQKRGGGRTHAKIFWWIWLSVQRPNLSDNGPIKVINLPPKIITFPQKCDHIPSISEHFPRNHFDFQNMLIYALLTVASCIYALFVAK